MSSNRGPRLHELLLADLTELKLTQIAETYREVLDEASRQNTSMLLMFQVVAARYECGSIVITTNRIFREWGKIFDVDNTLATADPPSVCARRPPDAPWPGVGD